MGDGTGEGADGRSGAFASVPLVGVMMLDTRFPRHRRDIGRADGLPFATLHRRVPAARVARVVRAGPPDPALLEPFVEVGRALAADGATLLTTSCGFLHAWQEPLAERLPVPFVASALGALSRLRAMPPSGSPSGVLTFDASAFARAFPDVPDDVAVEGLAPGCHFRDVIERDLDVDDPARLAADVAEAAHRLAARGPDAVVLECTNLAPWRGIVERACGVPVLDLVDAVLEASRRSGPGRTPVRASG